MKQKNNIMEGIIETYKENKIRVCVITKTNRRIFGEIIEYDGEVLLLETGNIGQVMVKKEEISELKQSDRQNRENRKIEEHEREEK